MNLQDAIRPIWMYYYRMIQSSDDSFDSSLSFPVVSQTHLQSLLNETVNILSNEPSLLRIKGDFVVVGSIHGHILDLFRIIKQFGSPEFNKYLFLGNIIDYGEFSTETVILIFILKYLFPKNIFIIRGRHEFAHVCQGGAFSSELYATYGNVMIQSGFLKAFSYLPFGAIINDKVLCVHSGIGPNSNDISLIDGIQRPIFDSENITANELTFSRPSESLPTNTESSDYIYTFGQKLIRSFMNDSNIDLIIRCKQIVEGGIEYSFNNSVASICSTSNFRGVHKNNSGVILIKNDACCEQYIFLPLFYIKRMKAVHLSQKNSTLSLRNNIFTSANVSTSRPCLNSNILLASTLKSSCKLPILSSNDNKIVDQKVKPYQKSHSKKKIFGTVNNIPGVQKEQGFIEAKGIVSYKSSIFHRSRRSLSVWK